MEITWIGWHSANGFLKWNSLTKILVPESCGRMNLAIPSSVQRQCMVRYNWRSYQRALFISRNPKWSAVPSLPEKWASDFLDELSLFLRARMYFQQDGAPPHSARCKESSPSNLPESSDSNACTSRVACQKSWSHFLKCLSVGKAERLSLLQNCEKHSRTEGQNKERSGEYSAAGATERCQDLSDLRQRNGSELWVSSLITPPILSFFL